MNPERFDFERSRGIVWCCDLVDSSRHLNDDESVDALEEFLPRLHWIASQIVSAAGGVFVKWTGDGFLAWFETPLYRLLGKQAAAVFEAAWHLTFLVNVTQLGVASKQGFRVRHGVTYEQDALLTKIVYPGGFETLDLTGRGVVLACRLAGIKAAFPGITTQHELVQASSKHNISGLSFGRWQPTSADRLRFFKGERWGTAALYCSTDVKTRRGSVQSVVTKVKTVIASAESEASDRPERLEFALRFQKGMNSGPAWCRDVLAEHLQFVKEDLLGNLKAVMPLVESMAKAKVRMAP